jgi:Uma2 family endonuclease
MRRQAVTVVHDRPVRHAGEKITVEEFEELESGTPELVSLEFLYGRVEVKAVPDGDHGTIVVWLIRQCMQSRPELDVYTDQGLQVESCRKGRARPDATLVPRRHLAGQGEWASVDGVLLTAEVTSFDEDTDQRDRVEKPRAYAEAGIPVYLLIDRDHHEITVHAEPVDGRYTDVHTTAFGKQVRLPAPVDMLLDTEELTDYIR